MSQPAANQPYKLPPPLFDARCKACWFSAGLVVLVIASFWSLDLQWGAFLSLDAAAQGEVEVAVAFAEASGWEPLEELLRDVHTTQGAA